MITIVKAIAVGAALSGSPMAHSGGAPSLEAGAPVIKLDQIPTERAMPLAPNTRVAMASARSTSARAAPGVGTEVTSAPSLTGLREP